MATSERFKAVTFKMPRKLIELARERAHAEGQSVSALVRDALLKRVVAPMELPRRRRTA